MHVPLPKQAYKMHTKINQQQIIIGTTNSKKKETLTDVRATDLLPKLKFWKHIIYYYYLSKNNWFDPKIY